MPSEFAAVVERPSSEAVVVRLSGELDIGSVDSLQGALRQVEAALASRGASPAPDVFFDLRALQFIDSTGLRALIETKDTVEQGGARMVLVEGPEPVMKVFRITKLDERFEIVQQI